MKISDNQTNVVDDKKKAQFLSQSAFSTFLNVLTFQTKLIVHFESDEEVFKQKKGPTVKKIRECDLQLPFFHTITCQ